jgi:type IV pilus assembly protein PilW
MNTLSPKQRGFTLAEILVAMIISLLTVLAIMQSLSVFESIRRNTTGAGDAQTSAALAVYSLERDLRMAGYGMVSSNSGTGVSAGGLMNICGGGTVAAYSELRPDNKAFVYNSIMPFVPFEINPSGATADSDPETDVLIVNYGSSEGMIGDATKITTNLSSNAATVSTRAGLHIGDLVMLVGPPGSTDCLLAEITNMPSSGQCNAAAGSTTEITIGESGSGYSSYWSGTPYGSNCTGTTAIYNKPGGVPVTAMNGGRVANLGQRDGLVSKVYAVRNGNLTVCNMLTHDCTKSYSGLSAVERNAYWRILASNVVRLKFQYFNGSNWINTKIAAADMNNWGSVRAMRIAIVTRSEQMEREAISYSDQTQPNAAGSINYFETTAGVSSFDMTTNNTDWAKYRYKLSEASIALPNLIGMKNIPDGTGL